MSQEEPKPLAGYRSSESIAELKSALLEAQKVFPAIKRSAQYNDGVKAYRYPTWADICTALTPSLHERNLVFSCGPVPSGEKWALAGTLYHTNSGEWETHCIPILNPSGDPTKGHPQDFETAVTYAKKTLFKAMVGGYEEGEGDEATEPASQPMSDEEEKLLTKIEGQLDLVKGNPKKLAEVYKRIDALVEKGEARADWTEGFEKRYPRPEKAEKKGES